MGGDLELVPPGDVRIAAAPVMKAIIRTSAPAVAAPCAWSIRHSTRR